MGNTHNHYEEPATKKAENLEEQNGGFHILELHAPTAGAAIGSIFVIILLMLLLLYCCLKYRKNLARRIQSAAN